MLLLCALNNQHTTTYIIADSVDGANQERFLCFLKCILSILKLSPYRNVSYITLTVFVQFSKGKMKELF